MQSQHSLQIDVGQLYTVSRVYPFQDLVYILKISAISFPKC